MKNAAILTIVTVLASVFFYLQPQVDLYVSSLFYDNGFVLQKGNPAAIITDLVHYGLRGVVFAGVGIAALLLIIGKAPGWLNWRKFIFVVLSIALTAGFMTNVVLKDHWGRARPNQVAVFGGTKQFTPAWVISDQCGKNCSFVGGDVSFAFSLLAIALLAQRRRVAWIGAVVMLGCLIAVARMAAGGHFFSDCVLAGLLTSTFIVIFHNIYYTTNSRGENG